MSTCQHGFSVSDPKYQKHPGYQIHHFNYQINHLNTRFAPLVNIIGERGFHAGPSLQETVTYQLGMQPLLDRSPHDGDGGAVMVMMIISYLFLLLYILLLKTHFCVIIKPI